MANVIAGSYQPAPIVVQIHAVANINRFFDGRLKSLYHTRQAFAFLFLHRAELAADMLHKDLAQNPQWLGADENPELCAEMFEEGKVPSVEDFKKDVGVAVYSELPSGHTKTLFQGLQVRIRTVSGNNKLNVVRLSPWCCRDSRSAWTCMILVHTLSIKPTSTRQILQSARLSRFIGSSSFVLVFDCLFLCS